jgi:chromate transporter
VSESPLVHLAVTFALLSIVAIGGLNAVLPEIHQQVVEVRGWMTDDELAKLVAIAQAAPGPNGLVVSLVGWRVAGWAGFAVATLAMAIPPALLAFATSRLHRRLAAASWLGTVQAGLVPITIGLILASGVVMARAADDTPVAAVTTVLVALAVWHTRLNPLWLLGAGAALGLVGA